MRNLFFFIFTLLFTACMSANTHTDKKTADRRDSIQRVLHRMNQVTIGDTDSLLNITLPLFYAAPGDVDSMLRYCAGIYNAQEFVFVENMDSAKYYIDYFMDREKSISGTSLEGLLYGIVALYEIKANRDYSMGIQYLIKSYEGFEKVGDYVNMTSVLINIVSFFYTNSDISGMEYAKKAYLMAGKLGDPYLEYMATISMAQMLSLEYSTEQAFRMIERADSIADRNGIVPLRFENIAKASCLAEMGMCESADSIYAATIALGMQDRDGLSEMLLAFMRYGEFKESQGRYEEALALYEKGLSLACGTSIYAYRDKLLTKASECAMRTGRHDEAIEYFETYIKLKDSLSIIQYDKNANLLTLRYWQMEHELEMQKKDIELVKADKKILVISFCIAILIILTISTTLIYVRQKKMYRTLVLRYQDYVRQTTKQASVEDKKNAGITALRIWNKIESMMNDEKLYCRKDLTMDSFAEKAGTNRTYLSKAINQYSKGDFYHYINRYRIREAVHLIESPEGKQLSLKSIAEMVGYNSVQVFHKAFVKETGLSPGKYRNEIEYQKKQATVNN